MVTDMEIERVIDYWQKNNEMPFDGRCSLGETTQ